MIFPARTKNAIAIMEVESSPPKILCVTTLNVSVISGENMMADMVAIARDTAIGTPSISRTINDPKSKNPVMMIGLPSDCFLLSLLPLLPFFRGFHGKIHIFILFRIAFYKGRDHRGCTNQLNNGYNSKSQKQCKVWNHHRYSQPRRSLP